MRFSGPRILPLRFGVTTDAPLPTVLLANVNAPVAPVAVPRGTRGMTGTETGTRTPTGGTTEREGDVAGALTEDAALHQRGGGMTVIAVVLLPWKTSRRKMTATRPAVRLLPLNTKVKWYQ